jgi:hypothetical protein
MRTLSSTKLFLWYPVVYIRRLLVRFVVRRLTHSSYAFDALAVDFFSKRLVT